MANVSLVSSYVNLSVLKGRERRRGAAEASGTEAREGDKGQARVSKTTEMEPSSDAQVVMVVKATPSDA